MSNMDGGTFACFIPHRLFANQLTSGFFELSVHSLLNSEDGACIDQIEWEIVSEDSDCLLRSTTPVPNQEASSCRAVQIAAMLPPSWDRGVLKVQFESNRTVSQFELPIDRLTQEVDFLQSGDIISNAYFCVIQHCLASSQCIKPTRAFGTPIRASS